MFGQGNHTFAMFYMHVHMHYVKNGEHITLTTFTQFAQTSTVVSMLALYGSIIHVATL